MLYSEEYVLFSVLVVIGSFVIHLILRRRVTDLSSKEVTSVFRYYPGLFFLFTILLIVAGLFLNSYFEKVERDKLIFVVDGFLPTLSKKFEDAGHSYITLNTKANDPTYQLVLRKAKNWASLSGLIQCIYTIRKYSDGKNYIIIDTPVDYNRNGKIDGDLERSAPIGVRYEEYIPELEQAFEGATTMELYPTTDKWGSSIGGFSPIYKDGKVEAVIGIDFDGKLWTDSIKRVHYLVISYLMVPALLLFFFYWSLINQRIFVTRNYRLAHYDVLTAVPNRLLFEKTIRETFFEASQLSGSFSILLLDVDKFKIINDKYGHLSGDLVLKIVADRLIRSIGNKEAIFRVSGDEFVVLLLDQGVVEAKMAAEKIEQSFLTPIPLEDDLINLSISIGIAHFPTNGHSIKELISYADTEMYQNKTRNHRRIDLST